jgi:hypothetical protein
MYLGHGSWVPLVIFGAMFAMRYYSSQRRRGRAQGPMSRSSFTDPGRRPPPPSPPDSGPTGRPNVEGGGQQGGTAPGWFRDPFFKHEHRYWSGTEWTEHVNDGDVPGTDPPPPAAGARPQAD